MKRKNAIQNTWLYRHRYTIAGVLLALIALFVTAYRFWGIPNGLTSAEISSATLSSQLSIAKLFTNPISQLNYLINLPWLLLQACSIRLLGLSVMAIRLPAVIVTLAALAILVGLIRRMTKPSWAVIGGLLAVSSSFTISLARSGVPAAMTTLLLVGLLLAGHYLINCPQHFKNSNVIVAAVVAGLLSYMTAGIYLVIAILLVILMHPRVRLVSLLNKKKLAVAISCYLLTISPLIIGLAEGVVTGNRQLINNFVLLGMPSWSNVINLVHIYIGFNSSVSNGLVAPMLTVVGGIIAAIGLVIAAYQARVSVRFYLLIVTVVAALLIGACQPSLAYLLFIPTIILETSCLGHLTNRWYSLFPVNPYARVFAILPLTILIGSLSSVDITRFFEAVSYSSQVVYSYDYGLPVLNQLLTDQANQHNQYTVFVPKDRQAFYRLLENRFSNVHVYSTADGLVSSSQLGEYHQQVNHRLVILSGCQVSAPQETTLTAVYTNWHSRDNLVAAVYK